jgi:hypothetical protein
MHSLKMIGFISGARGDQSMSWPRVIAILKPHENHEWRSCLAGTGLYHHNKAFLQSALLHFAKCAYTEGHPVDLYDGAFQPLHARSSPNSEQTHNHCTCR